MFVKHHSFDTEIFFQALADPTRLRLLNLLADGEVCVCHLVEVLGTNQPKVSRHLAYLRRAGLVTARRQGTWMHYRVTEPRDELGREVFASLRTWLNSQIGMQSDRRRLRQVVEPLTLAQVG
jgi:ArsR family transcriptional regulator, arsenate/arsenite/antimonite-responsive transcriptional repressor